MRDGAVLPLDDKRILADLESEIGLGSVEARVFVAITTGGMMSAEEVAGRLGVGAAEAAAAVSALADLGALIELSGKFEAMHPRFTAVNMYRKACRRRGEEPGRNNAVDAIGAALEQPYDDARTGSRT